ncbi:MULTISPECIES: hypothetical protein [Klebsiella]|uniref:hypothetical protein n=1 Tax=Klebsiella TaxID=570 RepID=UPI0015606E5A|nr:hypothetical protein [Klebsiella michiganensis]MDL4446660.1 hypothetical protein [Klebsiella michiganensis]MDL4490544.1 hypothetical protein [Klebsiella michiganensis]MDL4659287.1 hypothetical protein [Klebsiella michiganensis]NRE85393.1 hypothetical protein [Klebsiella michiganensis]
MLIVTPKIDLNSERWFYPYKKPEDSKKEFSPEEESLFKLRLLVASSENSQYRSRNALVRRHIDKMDAGYKVGTKEFNLASVGDIDSVDDLLIDNVARFLLKGWEGVGQLVDGTEVALDYTPELGTAMLKQHPELYWLILAEAANIAQGKEQQTQETVKKP